MMMMMMMMMMMIMMCRLVVSSYLDWQTDQDSDLVFQTSSRPDLLSRCDHELSFQQAPAGSRSFSRTLTRHSPHYCPAPSHTLRVFQWNVLAQGRNTKSPE